MSVYPGGLAAVGVQDLALHYPSFAPPRGIGHERRPFRDELYLATRPGVEARNARGSRGNAGCLAREEEMRLVCTVGAGEIPPAPASMPQRAGIVQVTVRGAAEDCTARAEQETMVRDPQYPLE